jgi:hypothetical protein
MKGFWNVQETNIRETWFLFYEAKPESEKIFVTY